MGNNTESLNRWLLVSFPPPSFSPRAEGLMTVRFTMVFQVNRAWKDTIPHEGATLHIWFGEVSTSPLSHTTTKPLIHRQPHTTHPTSCPDPDRPPPTNTHTLPPKRGFPLVHLALAVNTTASSHHCVPSTASTLQLPLLSPSIRNPQPPTDPLNS